MHDIEEKYFSLLSYVRCHSIHLISLYISPSRFLTYLLASSFDRRRRRSKKTA